MATGFDLDSFSIVSDIIVSIGPGLEHLAYSQFAPGHQLQHQPISGVCCPGYNLINHLFLKDVPPADLSGPK